MFRRSRVGERGEIYDLLQRNQFYEELKSRKRGWHRPYSGPRPQPIGMLPRKAALKSEFP